MVVQCTNCACWFLTKPEVTGTLPVHEGWFSDIKTKADYCGRSNCDKIAAAR